jgi:hypothetical protein
VHLKTALKGQYNLEFFYWPNIAYYSKRDNPRQYFYTIFEVTRIKSR